MLRCRTFCGVKTIHGSCRDFRRNASRRRRHERSSTDGKKSSWVRFRLEKDLDRPPSLSAGRHPGMMLKGTSSGQAGLQRASFARAVVCRINSTRCMSCRPAPTARRCARSRPGHGTVADHWCWAPGVEAQGLGCRLRPPCTDLANHHETAAKRSWGTAISPTSSVLRVPNGARQYVEVELNAERCCRRSGRLVVESGHAVEAKKNPGELGIQRLGGP